MSRVSYQYAQDVWARINHVRVGTRVCVTDVFATNSSNCGLIELGRIGLDGLYLVTGTKYGIKLTNTFTYPFFVLEVVNDHS